MRVLAVALLLFVAIGQALAQNAPGSVVTCPTGTVGTLDINGVRTCTSRSQKPLFQGLEPQLPAAKRKHRRFEMSKKCPECK